MRFNIPDNSQPIIKVIGVGGGGSNAVNYMFKQGIVGVDFAICNTDSQAMDLSPIPTKIQLGPNLTEGRGAGSKPAVGKEACIESLDEVREFFKQNTKMIFVTAGMGGGTGTGAAPVIAKTAREMDILTVGIVTMPFNFEGRRRSKQAMEGLEELKKNVDTLIVISNDKLRQIYGNLSLSDAFSQADEILTTAAKGIAEIITVPGYVNVDFEDVNTVMRDSGVAVMGTAQAEGEDRARHAVEAALKSPLLEDNDIRGAQHILLNITSGKREVTMDEVFEITEYVQDAAGHGTDLIWGNCYDETLGDKISVTVIATGFETSRNKEREQQIQQVTQNKIGQQKQPIQQPQEIKRPRVSLDDDEPLDHKGNYLDNQYDDKKKDSSNKYQIEPETPYVKKQALTPTPPVAETYEQRRERLRKMSTKLNNPEVINQLENQPAYLRKGVKLDDVQHSAEPHLSKFTLSEDEDQMLRDNNSFLHDNVD
jgi:cell division protein FtsZ